MQSEEPTHPELGVAGMMSYPPPYAAPVPIEAADLDNVSESA